ncbi:MscL family protein [Candidatus Woesearchaeota archaeon]|nr:MscL family protein [Candidatus Woesearchaeota archaeon]
MVKKYVMEFKDFLGKYAIIGMAIGIIMGTATNTFVKSLVNDIIMPILAPVLPSEGWQEATLYIGPIAMKYGSFLSAVLNFVILAIVVFVIAKIVLREAEVKKK